MPILPIANSTAVAAAPSQTSLQAISTSGRILKIVANSIVVPAKETEKSTNGQTVAVNGSRSLKYALAAARNVLTTSDESSRTPIESTRKNESNRVRRMSAQTCRGRGVTSQLVFIASCN